MTKGLSMSEFEGQLPGNPAMMQEASLPHEPGASAVSAGALLREAREAAGLHIAALAVALKVPVKKLEALEDGRLDLLPDAVFVRALASSVCRTLKMDVAQVLALLPQTGKPHLGYPHSSINTPFRSPSDGPGPSLWVQVSRPSVLAGVLLLLGALVLIFLPAIQQHGTTSESAAGAEPVHPQPEQTGVAMVKPELPVSAKPAGPDSPNPLVEPEPAVAAPPAAPVLAPQLSSVPAQPLTVAAASPGPATPVSLHLPAAVLTAVAPAAPAQPVPAGIIVFNAKGESWVEVTDAKGVVVLRRTLTAGEAVGASGALPLAAVVGRADATQVQVRGRLFDLSAVSRDNVARFEVK
jgi:cytoskeleton protein RodZ